MGLCWGSCVMRFANVLIVAAISLVAGLQVSHATIINVEYAGTFTGSWTGNYDPLTGPFPYTGYSAGTYGSTPFTLKFQFDTELAQPGYYDASHLTTPAKSMVGYSVPQNPPSVGFADF